MPVQLSPNLSQSGTGVVSTRNILIWMVPRWRRRVSSGENSSSSSAVIRRVTYGGKGMQECAPVVSKAENANGLIRPSPIATP
ncbi:hypothetical protein PHLCEN_2v6229 [Hermanssonia centrifuga]|uniref:Uncharacterized protein n=1 Tax=Hermanssonia centrifuga TaxID=98765 RepID=A0A2R6NZY5_9APHY|nr:hypothetical protein PHLCEN_2v6229 [Hermanssonia centrifuga]